MTILDIDNLKSTFVQRNSKVYAVRGVSFSVNSNECIGIVGESGSGKSVLNLSLMRLLPEPPCTIEGRAQFDGIDLLSASPLQLQKIRGKKISMVFQDPTTALNPHLSIKTQMIEHLQLPISQREKISLAENSLINVGIKDVKRVFHSFPHELSGGMRQRIIIAIALIGNPSLVIADEPTTALDVTIQAQILRLFSQLREKNNLSIIFVTHNLGIVHGLCDWLYVMYAGMIIESGKAKDVLKNPKHPYTYALIKSIPSLEQNSGKLYQITGTPPNPSSELVGCPFFPRCQFSQESCKYITNELFDMEGGRKSACARVKSGEILYE